MSEAVDMAQVAEDERRCRLCSGEIGNENKCLKCGASFEIAAEQPTAVGEPTPRKLDVSLFGQPAGNESVADQLIGDELKRACG